MIWKTISTRHEHKSETHQWKRVALLSCPTARKHYKTSLKRLLQSQQTRAGPPAIRADRSEAGRRKNEPHQRTLPSDNRVPARHEQSRCDTRRDRHEKVIKNISCNYLKIVNSDISNFAKIGNLRVDMNILVHICFFTSFFLETLWWPNLLLRLGKLPKSKLAKQPLRQPNLQKAKPARRNNLLTWVLADFQPPVFVVLELNNRGKFFTPMSLQVTLAVWQRSARPTVRKHYKNSLKRRYQAPQARAAPKEFRSSEAGTVGKPTASPPQQETQERPYVVARGFDMVRETTGERPHQFHSE